MEQLDIKRAQEDFYKLLENDNDLTPTVELFKIIENYAKSRVKEETGMDYPIHVFFKEDVKIERNNGYFYAYRRYNPITKKICEREWNGGTRAFMDERGEVYISFDTMDNYHKPVINSYNKASHLIDFAFTLEHELTHVKQKQEELRATKTGAPTFEAIRMAKDSIAIEYSYEGRNESARYFYVNGHNRFHIELEANKNAEAIVRRFLLHKGLMTRKVSVPGSTKEFTINDILGKRIDEAKLGTERNTELLLSQLFGVNGKKDLKLVDDPEKIIDLLIDELVRENPQRYLTPHPVLRHIYNNDGSRKTFQEIKEIVSEHPEREEFYTHVVVNDALLSIQRIEDEMVNDYLSAKTSGEKQMVLNTGLSMINEIVERENLDLDNILVYLDRRSHELDNAEMDEKERNTSKLIHLVTKQALLKKEDIREAYSQVSVVKNNVIKAQNIVAQYEAIDFEIQTREEIIGYLQIIKQKVNLEPVLHNYRDKGMSPDDVLSLSNAVDVCFRFYTASRGSHPITTPQNKPLNSMLKGYDSLYETNYYKNIIEKNNANTGVTKADFELANQIYIECQKFIGLTGMDEEHSFVALLGNSPLIAAALKSNPNIVNLLCSIREMEEKTTYLTRLDATISMCRSYLERGEHR